jgi:hypothetical protein
LVRRWRISLAAAAIAYLMWLQYMLLDAPFAAVITGGMVFAGTLLLSLMTVAAIRRIPTAARIIGVQNPRGTDHSLSQPVENEGAA